MRLSIHHTETLTYATPSMGTIQVLRLTPRDHTGHYVCDWSVDVDADCKIESNKDAFGNIVTSFSLNGPLETLTISAVGEIETEETHGIVRGAADQVPHGVFLRPSHAEGDAALVRTAMNAIADVSGPELAQMHALMAQQIAGSEEDALNTSAATRLRAMMDERNIDNVTEIAEIFCNTARRLGLPARLVSGYRWLGDDKTNKQARDIWAEVHVVDRGWV
ncbi:unnamed protein product, partial [Chrysoparadoxa australica]